MSITMEFDGALQGPLGHTLWSWGQEVRATGWNTDAQQHNG